MRRVWTRPLTASLVILAWICVTGSIFAAVTQADTEQVEISAQPSLYPTFEVAVSDYVTRCTEGTPVQVSVSAPPGTEVAVDTQPPRSGTFSAYVSLAAGESFTVTTTSGGSTTGTYYVRCLPADFWTWTSELSGQPQAEWYIVSRRGTPLQGQAGIVAIFDTNGVPVWWMHGVEGPGASLLLRNGNLGWSHNPPVTSGAEERQFDGSLVRTLDAVGAATDFHEFLLLPNGNYLLGANVNRPGFSLCGRSDLTIRDTGIQEIAADGLLVWSWYPSDHIPLSEIPIEWCNQILNIGANTGIYDPYHFNSAEPDGGAFVLSFRHLDAVYKISKATGDVEWKIGGTPRVESLATVGDSGSGPWGGHDARVLGDGTVSVHDNGFHPTLRRTPRAIRYEIDPITRTATLLEQVNDPGTVTAGCCGSARKLPGGNWVMAWGGNPLVTELTPSGSRVYSLAFQNGASTYRAYPVQPGVLSRSALRAGMDARHPRFPRPGGATPLRVPLVPEFSHCDSSDSTHAPPLDSPSCSNTGMESELLTTSSLGKATAGARFDVAVGNPSTPEDEADVALKVTIRDVRNQVDDSDYVGQLLLATEMRITDSWAPHAPATMEDAAFAVPMNCVSTPQPDPQTRNTLGGSCEFSTTLDTLIPGFAREGARAVIAAFSVAVKDAGRDATIDPASGCPPTCGTGDEAVFLRQGAFLP